VIIVILAAASGPGCASDGGGGQGRSTAVELDVAIAGALTTRLAEDEQLDGASIRVTVTAGVVVLEGSVASADQVRRALRHAARVDGVRQVVNRLLVIGSGTAGPSAVRAP